VHKYCEGKVKRTRIPGVKRPEPKHSQSIEAFESRCRCTFCI